MHAETVPVVRDRVRVTHLRWGLIRITSLLNTLVMRVQGRQPRCRRAGEFGLLSSLGLACGGDGVGWRAQPFISGPMPGHDNRRLSRPVYKGMG